jgi:hypothetical protein
LTAFKLLPGLYAFSGSSYVHGSAAGRAASIEEEEGAMNEAMVERIMF